MNISLKIRKDLRFTIFDKYIITQFLKTFIGSLLFIVFLNSIIEIIERLEFYISRKIGFFQILTYYFFRSPYFIMEFAPIATVFATVFTISSLTRNKEFIAILTAGISYYRVILYLYIVGFVISLFLIYFNDLFVVPAYRKAVAINNRFKNIYYEKDRSNFAMYGDNNIIYYVRYYNSRAKILQNLQIIKVNQKRNKVLFRIDANLAVWNEEKKCWIIKYGIYREFDENGEIIKVEEFTEKIIPLKEKPEDFEYTRTNIHEMRIGEAKRYINTLKVKGFEYQEELVNFHTKFSFPFSNFIMMLIGAPFSVIITKNVFIISMGISLLTSFIYWVILNIGVSLGKNGMLPPFISVWIGNLIFIVLSFFLHKKIIK